MVFTLAASPADSEIADKGYVAKRDEIKAMYLVQSLLSWYVRTNGERSVFQETYKGHEKLFTKESIAEFDRLLKSKTLSVEDRKAIRFMKNAFLLEFVGIDTAHFDDDINNAETRTTVDLEGEKEPVPYRQLMVLMAQEKDPDKRKKLQEAQAKVWKEVLNPIYEKQENRVRRLAVEVGYPSYVALSENFREVDIKKLIASSMDFIGRNDALYKGLLSTEVQEVMGIPVEKFTRADIQYFSSLPAYRNFFPAELTVPAFRYFLEGMGLDLTTAAGTQIAIDDEARENKEPRAACYSMTVPDDIRVTVKPTGGIPDFETFFHEGGHAMHFANTTVPQWEFQQLGSNAVTEGFAIFFEDIWGDYNWLVKYRDFVKNYNRFQPVSKQAPLMTDEEIAKLVRNRVFWNLYMVRRYNGAKPIYESILHGGDPSYYKAYYSGSPDDPHQAYKKLFSDAYGFQLSDEDALRFRTDVDSFFYAADYARAFLLSAQLQEAVRAKFGEKWFENPEAGKFIKSLWSNGSKLHPDEIAKTLGYPEVGYEQFRERMERQLAFVNKTIGK